MCLVAVRDDISRFKVPVLLLLLPIDETCVVWHVGNRKGVTGPMLGAHSDHFKMRK